MASASCPYRTVHAEFALQAGRTPEGMAVRSTAGELTYRQLEQRSNALAQQLWALQVRPGDIVGLHMSRCIEFIIAQLAILKCGAAYLPLDKSNPRARHLHSIAEGAVQRIIVDEDAQALHGIQDLQLLRAGVDLDFARSSREAPQVSVSPEERAYVMFTSGSTGLPKGVMVAHRGIHRLVKDTNYIQISSVDAILQFSTLSFDAATFEIWGALLNGATLVLYPGTSFDPNLFAQQLRDNAVTILFMTTALFHIIATRFIGSLAPLRVLLTGGDVLYPSLINKVADAYPNLQLLACYGPTENTSFTTTHLITPDNHPVDNVPIGHPINGTQVHVLDEALRPVEAGKVGELYVSGAGVALGYLQRAHSRADFFAEPDIAPGLIYRTGDLVRRNTQGALEFIGRLDNQIKIRGFRASLEEIQSALLEVPQVQDAVVLLRKFDTGDQQLIACVRLAEQATLSATQLKRQLGAQVPPYMVPDRIVLGSEFPLNSHGKICRDSLRKMLDQLGMES